jgi:hypothetical protein
LFPKLLKFRASGSLTNSSAEVKKQLDEQLNRLAQKHGILSADQIAKLSFKPQPPVVSSSVAALVEGKPVSQLMTEMEVRL